MQPAAANNAKLPVGLLAHSRGMDARDRTSTAATSAANTVKTFSYDSNGEERNAAKA
jgi:hypothetical protein